ncbi:hypothetical protein E2C01_065907 [Portunus trituberculatus]|uniref:Uncharacterized protein n=1 Tax=Portunus trituberculatus TaxID=210409 RepID=A0A5B7HNE5_PORTR|nr:hypothetical protein [Portunus trituberculatus]
MKSKSPQYKGCKRTHILGHHEAPGGTRPRPGLARKDFAFTRIFVFIRLIPTQVSELGMFVLRAWLRIP